METLMFVGKSREKSSELVAIERLSNDVKQLTEKVMSLENKVLECCSQANTSASHGGDIFQNGMVFAGEVAALSPEALEELDAGLINIAHMLVPANSPSMQSEEESYEELLALFSSVRLRVALPIDPSKSDGAIHDTMRCDRNQRLEDILLSWRTWAGRSTGMAAYETLYQLIKFRGIDLNEYMQQS